MTDVTSGTLPTRQSVSEGVITAAQTQRLKRDLIIAASLTIFVLWLERGGHLFPVLHHSIVGMAGLPSSEYVQFVLTTLVLLGPGRHIYRSGLSALWRGAPDMNSLIVVGTAAAYGYSVVATFIPSLLPAESVSFYYDASAVIVTLTLLSRMLEASVRERMSVDAKGLAGRSFVEESMDKVTLRFVLAVMGAAALTFLVWLVFGPAPALTLALLNAVAVLIVASPSAILMATPMSIRVAIGRGAQLGVLFRNGEALQQLRDIKAIAVNKTGVLTQGRPELTDLTVLEGYERTTVLSTIAAVESKSEHPVARAIVAAAQDEDLVLPALESFESVTGYGIKAVVKKKRIDIGADRYMNRLGLDVSVFSDEARRLGDQGKSLLYVAIQGRLAAILAVSDPIKSSTKNAVDEIHALGIKVLMVTGDNKRTARAIAKQLGMDDVIAEVLPAGKVNALSRLKARHGKLAFMGDGINDAPALAGADVGIGIGRDFIAIEAADVVLIRGGLAGVSHAIALSRASVRNSQQNLFWAFAYNVALITVAAGILYPLSGVLLSPISAAVAMALASIFVLTNALRLKRFQP